MCLEGFILVNGICKLIEGESFMMNENEITKINDCEGEKICFQDQIYINQNCDFCQKFCECDL